MQTYRETDTQRDTLIQRQRYTNSGTDRHRDRHTNSHKNKYRPTGWHS